MNSINPSTLMQNNRPQIMNLGSHDFDIKQLLEFDLQILEMKKKPHLDRIEAFNSEKRAWESLQKNLESLKNLLSDVKNFSTENKSINFGSSEAVTGVATSKALDGKYSIQVDQLASSHRVSGSTFTNETLGINETILINGKELEVKEDMSLRSLAREITRGDFGVDAIVLNNQLVLTSSETGTDNEISLESESLFQNLGIINSDGEFQNVINQATNALYSINGISFESSSNNIDSIEGVSLTLNGITTSEINFDISESTEKLVENFKKFVTGYNQMMDVFEDLSGEGKTLQGKGVPRSLKTELNSLMHMMSESGVMMSDIGISFDPTKGRGKVEFDEEIFISNISNNKEEIQKFLLGENGFLSRFESTLDRALSSRGSIVNETRNIEEKIRRAENNIDRIESNSSRARESLIRKYAELEVMLNQLELQNKMMTAQIDAFNNRRR